MEAAASPETAPEAAAEAAENRAQHDATGGEGKGAAGGESRGAARDKGKGAAGAEIKTAGDRAAADARGPAHLPEGPRLTKEDEAILRELDFFLIVELLRDLDLFAEE